MKNGRSKIYINKVRPIPFRPIKGRERSVRRKDENIQRFIRLVRLSSVSAHRGKGRNEVGKG